MLTKCANPLCPETFRHLESGTLFRLEYDRAGSIPDYASPQYFWLCHHCSPKMTLRLDEANGIKVVQIQETTPREEDSPPFPPLDRHNGLLLSGIKFTGHRARRHARDTEGGFQI